MKKTEFFPHDNTTLAIKDQQAIRQAYRAALSFTDRNIGVVLAGLDGLGFADTTIVALWADHGCAWTPQDAALDFSCGASTFLTQNVHLNIHQRVP